MWRDGMAAPEGAPRAEATRGVGVFRLQLFKPSETFITAQAALFRRHAPTYIGRTVFGPPPEGARVATPGKGRLANARLVALRDPAGLQRALAGQAAPALIHCHFAIDAVYALPLARRLGAPLVVTIH